LPAQFRATPLTGSSLPGIVAQPPSSMNVACLYDARSLSAARLDETPAWLLN